MAAQQPSDLAGAKALTVRNDTIRLIEDDLLRRRPRPSSIACRLSVAIGALGSTSRRLLEDPPDAFRDRSSG